MQRFTPVDQSAVDQKVVDQFAVDQSTPHLIFTLQLNVIGI
jgi:hypothetical protein